MLMFVVGISEQMDRIAARCFVDVLCWIADNMMADSSQRDRCIREKREKF